MPNDPRGSGSTTVRNDVLGELGELHFGRKAVQPPGAEVREFYDRAIFLLQHPLLTMDEVARNVVAEGFARAIEQLEYTCYACAIMPDHVHMLIRKHRHTAEEMIEQLKLVSRIALVEAGIRSEDHPTWAGGGGWKVFLDHPEEVWRTIKYIRRNPVPLGLPVQEWPFVKAYNNWPLHPGHSPKSPYVRALKAAGRYP